MKMSVVYFSKTNKTKEMAEIIAESGANVGVEVKTFSIENIDDEFLNESDVVIIGTPTYYANMSWQMKKWIDSDSTKYNFSKKLVGAFATANVLQGGADIAIMGILQQMLVKGAMVYSSGNTYGQPIIHLGPVAIRDTFEQNKEIFKIYGERMAKKGLELFTK